MFLCASKSTLFGLSKVESCLFTTEQHNPNVQICATHFMDDCFVNLGREQGWLCMKAIKKLKKKGQF